VHGHTCRQWLGLGASAGGWGRPGRTEAS
jgi:hypothetical protein